MTYYQREKKRLRANRVRNAELLRALKSKPCMDCGQKYPSYVMDFDHRPGTEKKFGLKNMGARSVETILAEVAKCDLVCANCHRERTHQRQVVRLLPEA